MKLPNIPRFRGSKDGNPLSDEDRITRFFSEVKHHRGLSLSPPNLEEFFKWARKTWREKCEYQASKEHLEGTVRKLDEKGRDQAEKLQRARLDHQNAEAALKTLQQDFQAQERRHEEDKGQWRSQKDWEANRHKTELHKTRVAHNSEIGNLRTDIMVNQRDSKAWTDEKLKKWVEDLRLRVQDLAPVWMEGPGGRVPHQLDPTGFISRAGMQDFPHLVRSTIWAVLIEDFFSMSYGFGALGPQGRSRMLETYRAWRSLFEGGHDLEGEQKRWVPQSSPPQQTNKRSSSSPQANPLSLLFSLNPTLPIDGVLPQLRACTLRSSKALAQVPSASSMKQTWHRLCNASRPSWAMHQVSMPTPNSQIHRVLRVLEYLVNAGMF